MKLFEYDEWKDQYYDHLLGYLYEICKYEGLKKVFSYKIDNLKIHEDERYKSIIKKFLD